MRPSFVVLTLLASTAVATSALAQVPTDTMFVKPLPSVELPADLARVLTDYETAYRQSGEAVAALFVEDGFVLTGGRPPIKGRPAIANFYGGMLGPLALRALAYGAEGSVGYIIGAYSSQRGGPDMGKFTLTLRKERNGRWMIVSDMDNANRRR